MSQPKIIVPKHRAPAVAPKNKPPVIRGSAAPERDVKVVPMDQVKVPAPKPAAPAPAPKPAAAKSAEKN